jgi:8-amino-3,8-dideoxy-alpha-D-manno-octulosonate transaminase
MPGFEVFGKEEQEAINELFDKNGGILLAHSFDPVRNGIYRVREFEKAFASRLRSPYAQAVSSGTAALKVGLKALGVGPGDEVITQSFTFVATVEAILDTGATPIVVDIDDTLNICPKSLEAAITKKTKVILPVHMMGTAANMDAVMALAEKYQLQVLEDTAQACGGTYNGKFLGTIGAVGAFSTDAGKTLNTGEGGMVLANDENLFTRARAFHDHGHEYSTTVGRGEEAALGWGFNYRMIELQGAIGLVQLSKLDYILEKQRENKRKLKEAIDPSHFKFRTILNPEGDIADTLVIFLESAEQARKFVTGMKKQGLGTKNLPDAIGWHFAAYWSHIFSEDGSSSAESLKSRWKQSTEWLERAVALPVMVNMEDATISKVAETINRLSKEL